MSNLPNSQLTQNFPTLRPVPSAMTPSVRPTTLTTTTPTLTTTTSRKPFLKLSEKAWGNILIGLGLFLILIGAVLGFVFGFAKKRKSISPSPLGPIPGPQPPSPSGPGPSPSGQYIGVINKVAEPFYVVWLNGSPIGLSGNNTPKLLQTVSKCQSIEWASSSDLYNAWGTVGVPSSPLGAPFIRWALSDAARPIAITHISHGGGSPGGIPSYQNLDAYQNHIWKGDPSKSGIYDHVAGGSGMVVNLASGTKMSGPSSGQSGYAGLCDDCEEGNNNMLITILKSEYSTFTSWVPTIPNLSIGASQLVCNSTPAAAAGIWYGDGYDTTTLPPNLNWASTNDVLKVAKTINFNKDSLIEAGLYWTLDTSENITPGPPYPKIATNIVNFQSNLPAQCNSLPAGAYAWVTGYKEAGDVADLPKHTIW